MLDTDENNARTAGHVAPASQELIRTFLGINKEGDMHDNELIN